jgi:hypothetical protein
VEKCWKEAINPAQVDAFKLEEMYSFGTAASLLQCHEFRRLGPSKNCNNTREYESRVACENDVFTCKKTERKRLCLNHKNPDFEG